MINPAKTITNHIKVALYEKAGFIFTINFSRYFVIITPNKVNIIDNIHLVAYAT